MKKIYLFDLSDLFSLNNFSDFSKIQNNFPSENDNEYNKIVEETETNTHIIKKETWVSVDGLSKYTRTYSEPKNTKYNIKELESQLEDAVLKEEFEKAAKIRDLIKSIK